jgi:hypothetical protein
LPIIIVSRVQQPFAKSCTATSKLSGAYFPVLYSA